MSVSRISGVALVLNAVIETTLIMNADFSNILSKVTIERLAEVDEYEIVREVQVNPLFSSQF